MYIMHPFFSAVCIFGEGCIFECHCKTKECDSQTGECNDDGCADSDANDPRLQATYRWRGPGCQIG